MRVFPPPNIDQLSQLGVDDNSHYERAGDDHNNSAMHSGASISGAIPKGPPSRPAVGIQKTKQGEIFIPSETMSMR